MLTILRQSRRRSIRTPAPMYACAARTMRTLAIAALALLGAACRPAIPIVARPPDPPPCHSVQACVELAARNPATFTPTLDAVLRKQPAAVLVAGAGYVHPQPAVNARVQRLLVLTVARVHTPESVQALLDRAVSTGDRKSREEIFELVSWDASGWPVLKRFIDTQPAGSPRWEALLAYLKVVGVAGMRTRKEAALHPGSSERLSYAISPELQQDLNRYAEEIWQRYVISQEKEEEESELEQVMDRPELMNRFLTLVEKEIFAGVVPRTHALAEATQIALQRPIIGRRLLGWAESPAPAIRRVVTDSIVSQLEDMGFPREDYSNVRRILIAGARNGGSGAWLRGFGYALSLVLYGLSATEAAEVAGIFFNLERKDRPQSYEDRVMLPIADHFPEHRAPMIDRLLHGPLRDAWPIATEHRTPIAWMDPAIRDWMRSLPDEALQVEETQERFLFLAEALDARAAYAAQLPQSRTPYRNLRGCDVGPNNPHIRAIRRADLAAFGLPAPPEPASSELDMVTFAPLSPKEATERWQQFLLARARFLREPGNPSGPHGRE